MSRSIIKYGVFALVATLLAGCSMNNKYYFYGREHHCWRNDDNGRLYCKYNYKYCDGHLYYYNDRHEVVCVKK